VSTLREAVELLASQWESWAEGRSTTRIDAFRDGAEMIRTLLAEHPATPAEEVAEVAVEGLTVRELVAELAMGPVEHFDLPAMDVLATRFAIHGAALTAKAKAEGRVEALREAADDEAWEWDSNAEAVRDWLRERADREAT
jgi:hypothetical protein